MNQVGIDISNEVFDATMQHSSGVVRKQFCNTKTGHRQFIRWALYQASSARICLEATGIYHLQLALALERHPDIEVMIVNPCAARRFAQAHMVRAKTDAVDAGELKVPLTTGILIGIGETRRERIHSLLDLLSLHEQYHHLCIGTCRLDLCRLYDAAHQRQRTAVSCRW